MILKQGIWHETCRKFTYKTGIMMRNLQRICLYVLLSTTLYKTLAVFLVYKTANGRKADKRKDLAGAQLSL